MTEKNKRQPVSKKTRFEVFKRDMFTCQYCGAKAPEVVLHADHINPVANGGDSGIMNLVTACAACNGGKGARRLDDRSAVERQRAQIEELEARREQLEMMLSWRDAAQADAVDVIEALSERIGERGGGYVPNESGKTSLRKWVKRFSLKELLEALDEAFDHYMTFTGDEPDKEAWERAFAKIPAIASLRRQAVDKPYMPKLAYIQGILRRRWRMHRENYIPMLESMHLNWEAPLDLLEREAKRVDVTDDLWTVVEAYAAKRDAQAAYDEQADIERWKRENPEPTTAAPKIMRPCDYDDGFDD
jgi:hypothetical protein